MTKKEILRLKKEITRELKASSSSWDSEWEEWGVEKRHREEDEKLILNKDTEFYRVNTIEEAVSHFLKPCIRMKATPDNYDERYFFYKYNVEEFKKTYIKKGGDLSKIKIETEKDVKTGEIFAWIVRRVR